MVLVITIALAGCTNFFYNRLDSFAAWYIEDLVSLYPQQRRDLRSWMEDTLQWHRRSELASYSEFLRELAARAARPGDEATYAQVEARVEAFGERLIERGAPDAVELLIRLTPGQLTEFQENLGSKARERNEDDLEALARGEWHEKRADDIRKQLRRWAGSVTDEQRELIAQLSQAFVPTTDDWLESQAQWRQALFGTLDQRLSAGEPRAAVEQRVLTLLRKPETEWTPAYETRAARNREQSFMVLAALDASLTPGQRRHLQRELIELAERLESLAG